MGKLIFREMRDKMEEHWARMTEGRSLVLATDVDKEEMWDLYLNSFPEGENEIYETRRSMDCNCCKSFIRNFGAAIVVNLDESITSIWDFELDGWNEVLKTMSDYVKSKEIKGAIKPDSSPNWEVSGIGTRITHASKNDKIVAFNHFRLEAVEDVRNRRVRAFGRDIHSVDYFAQVLRRSFNEITDEALDTTIELINSKSIYRGSEFLDIVEIFKDRKDMDKSVWALMCNDEVTAVVCRIRNTAIGTLLVNLSSGDFTVEECVAKFEHVVAPHNYKRPKPVFTKAQLERAKKALEDDGLINSIERKHATLEDVDVENVHYINRDALKVDIFSKMADKTKAVRGDYKNMVVISPEELREKASKAKVVELLVENQFRNNFCAITRQVNRDAKPLFKWDNGFGLSYNGDLADSSIRENVALKGGNVNGEVRFSIQWNENGDNNSDLDAHCRKLDGDHLYYGDKHALGGKLDVDIQYPDGDVAVENIFWPTAKHIRDGEYLFYVHNYSSSSNNKSGFKAEIEVLGTVYSFERSERLKGEEKVKVAKMLVKDGNITIKPIMDSTSDVTQKEIWNVTTNSFQRINAIIDSPNFWGKNNTGNRHTVFVIDKCKTSEPIRGMFNEFIKDEILVNHKRVLEAMGGMTKIEPEDKQLAGIGFSESRDMDLVVRIDNIIFNVVNKEER